MAKPTAPLTQEFAQLVETALEARKQAYAPHSGFMVGAALLACDGRVFRGVNVENSSYGLTICAERAAAVTAIAEGARLFRAIAVATDGGAAPCGACRQFLYEWGGNLQVLCVDAKDETATHCMTLEELMPKGFRL